MQDLNGKTIRGGVLQGSVPKARVLSCVWALMVFDSALGPERLWIVGMVAAFTGVYSIRIRGHGGCEQLHCHLEPVGSGKLRNIAGMVNPEGCLRVSGMLEQRRLATNRGNSRRGSIRVVGTGASHTKREG